ncbi:hypothetical protein PAMP_021691 [Pampus punctatissimus]
MEEEEEEEEEEELRFVMCCVQELQEEVSRIREEGSNLKEHCRHLEARRRHAHRCLSTMEAELTKHREEHSYVQLLKQEVIRDTAAAQQQLNESVTLLSLLSEQVEQKKKQLQTVEQVCVGLEDVKAAVYQLEDRGRRLTQRQLQLNQLIP